MTDATTTETVRQELEAVKTREKAPTVFDLIERMTPALERALPKHLGAERFARIVLTELRRTPKLMECSPPSLLGAMMQAAQLGLEPGPLGHVYLVPFKGEVTLIVGYKGMVDLAYRAGVGSITARTVYDGDGFEYEERQTGPFLRHRDTDPETRGEARCWYARAILPSGKPLVRRLWPADVEKRRARSEAAKSSSGPWVTDYDAMARKSCIRAMQSDLPQSPMFVRALAVDETAAPAVDVDEPDALAELEAFGGAS